MSVGQRDKLIAIFTGTSNIGPGSTIYSGLRTSLTLLNEAADALELPVLKGAVGSLLRAVEIIEKMSQNQDDAAELLSYLKSLEKMLNDTKTSESLATRIEDLSQEITKIVHDIQNMKDQSALSRFMRSDIDASALGGHIKAINRLFLKFLLRSSVAIELQVLAVVEGISKMEGSMSNIAQDVKDIKHLLQDGLPRVVKARFDGDKRQRCLEGTRVTLLDTVHQWGLQEVSRDGKPIPSIFWLCGQAGTGKTTIATSIATDFHDQGRLGASFFFSRDHSDRNDIQLVFPTLAHQLGTFCDEFRVLLIEILEKDPDLAYIDPAYQLKKLIIDPLKNCSSFPSSTVIVIDALDECKDDQSVSTLLSLLSDNLPLLPQLRFFITSRPENNVCLGFEPLRETSQSLILHEIDASIVDRDIELYLRQGLSTASRIYPHLVGQGWPSDEAINSLVRKSRRLFIFSATALKFIMDNNYSDPNKQLTALLEPTPGLGSLPRSSFYFLDQLYLQVLHQAFPKTTSPDRFTLVKMLLGTILLLRDPLSLEVLEDFLRLRRGVVRTTFSRLHSVMVVPDTNEHVIRLIHPSFFDFLTARCSDPQFRIDSTFYHEQLGILCFEQMKALKRDICDIKHASMLNSEINDLPERVERHISPALRYACHHWAFHLRNAGESPLLCGMLKEFCLSKLLYWIEVLSLTGSLRDEMRHIQPLLNHLTKFSFVPKETLAILKDTLLFIPEHFEVISSASLQLYRSALPLLPLSSPLCKAFAHELNGGVRILQRTGEDYSGVTILRDRCQEESSPAFSPDDTLVISVSDNAVRLWDRGTGTLLKTFKKKPSVRLGWSGIIWATFSPEGDRIIVGTSTATIWIWDVTTGVCLETIELQIEGLPETAFIRITCYCCSPDATRIVGSAGTDVLLWDVLNGSVIHTLRGHDYLVRSVAFSPNNTLIASGSSDFSIRLWDAASGTALKIFTGHSSTVSSIAFSPCSKYLVSGSWDRDLRLWDSASGLPLHVLKGHSEGLRSVSFSPNGTQIISCAGDNTLRVWDAAEGKSVKKLSVGRIRTAGFSFDSTHYICAVDKAVYVWDAERALDLDRSAEELIQVKFSADGTHLIGKALGVGKHDIHIWNGLTGAPLNIMNGPVEPFESLTLSPNGQYIASISNDTYTVQLRDTTPWYTIRLRNIFSTTTFRSLTGHYRKVDSVTFSPDSTQIVSTSCYDGTVRLWDIASGDNIFTFDIAHDHYDVQPTFSPDGSQIIADSHSYDIPPHLRSHPVPSDHLIPEKLEYTIEEGWVFACRGAKKERCAWIPVDWRQQIDISSKGRVAIGTYSGLVLLDLSGISLST